ncbi:hypothetical protein [Pseudomonas putida]|uniref:hypothetical protein n=1 Tax=Pseudomonas putida TaxID=303 RepID=UPI001EDB808D|nr:hypothetical protein [Pseudomonas putida]
MPTENRSSNTEMVSVPEGYMLVERSIWTEQQVEAATACITRLRGVHGMRDRDLAMAAIDAAQCKAPDIALADILPAPQPHPEPIAWMVGTAFWWTKEEAERDAAATGLPIVGMGPMDGAALSGAHALLREVLEFIDDGVGRSDAEWQLIQKVRVALSASAEPSEPIAWHVGGNGYDRICFEKPADLPGHPCIQAIHDQRQLINLLKRYDLRDEDVPPDDRAHGIPGTSFQRLNALANQGE